VPEPVHPKLLKIVEERDQLRKELRAERLRSAYLKRTLAQVTAERTAEAKPQQEQRAGSASV